MPKPKNDQNNPVTRKMVDQAGDAILNGINKLVDGLRSEMNPRFKSVDAHVDKVEDRNKSFELCQRFY